ncbi:DNA polymerase III subunit gamma/tau [Christiangramia sp. SM2212]|uniref:DNA polymerase III subunit gamma/tau n=1 Tax=Christiangramia sediminicola TaxID=3073267 RepID=A0ABU1EQ09_9FLAO|nr:DNA polymerase III subunit gamma/tau [Christiangramia sp. SM2212]MDR5590451.1 DNA polymerase III subunit gamma/tau [Christiangramia sp. SM2212]
MEHFVVSARKYRPQTFKDVVGQQAITNTLANAINNNHLAQALLFTGPRGVGKTTCARILAKMINQEETQDPDEDFAFNIFELDAASNNSVDDIRNLIDQVRIPPQVGNYKVYIIDEVHMLSASAFNAFLKTLEEPPKHAIFILATTEKHKIIPTILSRCQIFDFKRITVTDAKNYLGYIAQQEGVNAEDDALHIIAQKADGAMRDALSIYDRVVSFSGNNLTRQAVTENLNVLDYDTYMQVTDLILENNIPRLLVNYNDILSSGFDGHHFIAGLASHFRDLMVCKDQKTIALLEVGDQTKAKYFEQSQKTSHQFLLEAIDLANSCDLKYKTSHNQRLLVELCLMQLASVTFGEEKKKAERKIVPASNFEQEAVSIPKEKKELVRENEHDTSSPIEENKLPEQKVATESCAKDEEKEYYSEDSPASQPEKEFEVAEPVPENIEKTEPIQENPETETVAETTNENILSVESPEEKNIPVAERPEVNSEAPVALSESEEEKIEEPDRPTASTNSMFPEIKREKVSGLSLKSIGKKKELEEKQKAMMPTEKVMDDEYTEEDLVNEWKNYTERLKRKGEKILASIFESQTPTLKDKVIHLTFPNETMKLDLEREENRLMSFLKAKLRNTYITLQIHVDEATSRKYAFTPQEKYEKLKEANPLLDKLRATFDLDV